MDCGSLRNFCRKYARVNVDYEPGASILGANMGMKADGVLSRPIEQGAAIADANPGVISSSTRMTTVDDSLGPGELLLDSDLTTLQEREHAVHDARVVV